MKEYSIFDIIGPIMIGPSSSHTAGATRISYIARNIVSEDISEVEFFLHGSFAKTYKGHGTDKALLSGILGLLPDDENIRNAFLIANKINLKYSFKEIDLDDVHPNTVKIVMKTTIGKTWEVIGSSIGGGKAKIIKINDMDVEFEGQYTTLITNHVDKPGIVSSISAILSKYKVNNAFMKLYRVQKAANAILIVETDENINDEVVAEINKNKDINMAKVLKPII